ncbi:hypothetical protein JAAARDRAFT_406213 [Jaapia argillacea MUCL 33604]|uniref:C2H2-type domain-containing protein n=1 Tax=Jaapia argillacea MUCL 33604 TaxID=933084 RepID=A0A067PST5_9AGAM|nr:hypothetical protein JAAARDRAFT_406213 [Jaapia argillacea MUCL 33604]
MVDAHHSAPFVYHLPATNVHASNPQMTINTNIPPYFPPFNDFSPSVGTPSSYTSSPTPVQSVRVSPAGLRASRARRADRERPGAFICEICFQDFTRRCNLDAHTRSHLGLKPYACTECTRQFGTKSVLNRHKRALHPDLA